MCTTALTAPVNRRRGSQWLQPHDLVTIASVCTCVCAYKTSGDDGRYGRRLSLSSTSSRGVVDVVFVSLQHRDDDVVNASSSGCCNNVETKSSSSRRSSRQPHRHDDGVVPRRHLVDNYVVVEQRRRRDDEDVHDNVIVISRRRRRCQDDLDVVTTTRQRRQSLDVRRCHLSLSVCRRSRRMTSTS